MHSFSNQPLVSIICPLYNKKAYIQAAIDSVINQTYSNWEMIIIDDGSTDGSYEFVNDDYKNFERIHLYHRTDFKQNKGGSVCRNIGISLVKGEYIMFLDADDLLAQNCLLNRVKAVQEYSESNLFVFNEAYFVINAQLPFIKKTHYYLHKVMFLLSRDKIKFFLKRFLKYDLPWTISNTLWRKEFLHSLNGFDEHLQRLQDPEIHIRMLLSPEVRLQCFKYSTLPDTLIRLDPNRHLHIFDGQYAKVQALLQSIQKLVLEATELLKIHNKDDLVKYLDGYIFKAQIDLYHMLHDKDNTRIPEVKKVETGIIRIAEDIGISGKGLNNKWIRVYKWALHSNFLTTIRIPAVTYILFMIIGFYPKRQR